MKHIDRLRQFLLVILLIVSSTVTLYAKKDTDDIAVEHKEFTYVPTINGTLRAKFEYEPQIESYRFQVRNARVSLKGWAAPIVDYKLELDFCDEGKIKVLDVYGRVHIKKIMTFSLGQMRVPFSVDATRSPYLLFFANRSFVAKQVGNVRDVGFKVSCTPQAFPLVAEAGVFNGSGITEQKRWHKSLSASGKINYTLNGFKYEVGGQSIIPDSIRINLFDTSLSWEHEHFFIEGEYIYKHYVNNAFPDVHAYNILGNYDIPLRGTFSNLALSARFDSMTDHSNGVRGTDGKLKIDDYARKRITVGTTLSFIRKFQADLRLNYEKYFYSSGAEIKESDHDKIVLELMVHF